MMHSLSRYMVQFITPKVLYHYTHREGIERIQRSIDNKKTFDISAYTVSKRDFFRSESNLIREFRGNVRAVFAVTLNLIQ